MSMALCSTSRRRRGRSWCRAICRETLARVRDRLGGALALVSGRPIAEIDDFFAPLQFAAIGGHGAEMRPVADGPIIAGRAAPLDPNFKQRLKDIAARHPGVLVEDKGYSLALHYRQVPKQGVALIHDVKHAYRGVGRPVLSNC